MGRRAPASREPPPMKFFRPQAGPDAGRARQPLLAGGAPGRGPRRPHLGRRVGAVAGAAGRGPRRRLRVERGDRTGAGATPRPAGSRPGGRPGCLPHPARGGPSLTSDLGGGEPCPGAGRGGAAPVRSAGSPGADQQRPRAAVETALVLSRGRIRAGRGGRSGLASGPIRPGVVHARRPTQRSAPGRGGRGGVPAGPGGRGVGQDPAALEPLGELHVPGPGGAASGGVGPGAGRPLGVAGAGGPCPSGKAA